MLFGLAFLGVSKTRVRSGIARTDMRMSQKDVSQRTSGHGAATHAKLSRAAHARRVAGAAMARAQRFDPARAVRFAGIVPLLHQKTLPPAAHMLRRRSGGVLPQPLVPQDGEEAQDAAERMEPARAPEIVVAPRAAEPPPPNPSRRGGRSAISGWSDNSLAAVARRGRFGLSPPRFVPVVPHRARRAFSFQGQLRCLAPYDNRGRCNANLVAHRSVRRSGHRLRDLGYALGALSRCRQRKNAGNRRGHP
jgi:hypothetical protein